MGKVTEHGKKSEVGDKSRGGGGEMEMGDRGRMGSRVERIINYLASQFKQLGEQFFSQSSKSELHIPD